MTRSIFVVLLVILVFTVTIINCIGVSQERETGQQKQADKVNHGHENASDEADGRDRVQNHERLFTNNGRLYFNKQVYRLNCTQDHFDELWKKCLQAVGNSHTCFSRLGDLHLYTQVQGVHFGRWFSDIPALTNQQLNKHVDSHNITTTAAKHIEDFKKVSEYHRQHTHDSHTHNKQASSKDVPFDSSEQDNQYQNIVVARDEDSFKDDDTSE